MWKILWKLGIEKLGKKRCNKIFYYILNRYWIREGDYKHPRSCLDIRDRGFRDNVKYATGPYEIEPVKGSLTQTYCDFARHGGGWTLTVKSGSQSGWTENNVGKRNTRDVNQEDFSIFSYIDEMKQLDVAEVNGQK